MAPDYIEGPEAAVRFRAVMKLIVNVPRAEILRREEEYRLQSALNPRKRGPKKKAVIMMELRWPDGVVRSLSTDRPIARAILAKVIFRSLMPATRQARWLDIGSSIW